MKAYNTLAKEEAKQIHYIFMDIDDTLTTHGKLSGEVYQMLWTLYDKGYTLIPITGRPAGWCDLIIRQWPVTAVVGENGAFVTYFEGEQLKNKVHPSVPVEDVRAQLDAIKERVLQEIPGTRVAKDQFARKYDLAIDFNEDPPYLGFEVATKIQAICLEMGAEAKISSIHVNTWFGKYDKVEMIQYFMREVLNVEDVRQQALFFGDSPNDEPMFAYFPYSIGVANLKPFLGQLQNPPTYSASKESGAGFCEVMTHFLELVDA